MEQQLANFTNAPIVMFGAVNHLARSVEAELGDSHAALAVALKQCFGGKQARMITDFGEDANHGWRDSGTLDFIDMQGADEAEGLNEATTTKLGAGHDEFARWAIYKETNGRRVLVEIEWEYSNSAAAYGGLFELEA